MAKVDKRVIFAKGLSLHKEGFLQTGLPRLINLSPIDQDEEENIYKSSEEGTANPLSLLHSFYPLLIFWSKASDIWNSE